MSNIISVSIEDLGFDEFVSSFPELAFNIADSSARRAGNEGRKELISSSPKRYGDYARGWSVKNKSSLASGIEYVVHNKKKPSLVHLLEDGHEMFINGVYQHKRVRAFPHFEHAKDRAGDLFEQYFDKGLQRIK